MRMRKKKNLLPRMEACGALLIEDPRALRGRWRELLPGAKELRVELGCGKGRFTAETAAAEPDVLLIAVEKVPDAMVVPGGDPPIRLPAVPGHPGPPRQRPRGGYDGLRGQILSAGRHHQPVRGHHGPLGGPCTAGGVGRSVSPERRTRA